MPTTVKVSGVMAPTGRLLRARVYNPDGTTNGDVALTESPAGGGQYGGSASMTLADTTDTPYEYEAREVATQDAAGFAASTTVRRSRGTLGYVRSNVLYGSLADSLAEESWAGAVGASDVTDNGDGTYTVAFKKRDGSTTSVTRTFNPTTGDRT